MLGLALRIGFGHRRTRQSIAQLQLMKQPLALAHPQVNLGVLLQAPRERFPIPQMDVEARLGWGLAQPGPYLLQLLGR